MDNLLHTIDNTLSTINLKHIMKDEELYEGFSNKEVELYAKEAKERWGHTTMYKQSQERVKKLTQDDWVLMNAETEEIPNEIVCNMEKGPQSP